MFDTDLDFGVDEIAVTLDAKESTSSELKYPHLHISNILILEQLRGVVNDPPEDMLVLPAYGDKDGELKYIGEIELTSSNIISMKYLGLKVELVKSKTSPKDDFSSASSLVSIIKTLRKGDTVDSVSNYLLLASNE